MLIARGKIFVNDGARMPFQIRPHGTPGSLSRHAAQYYRVQLHNCGPGRVYVGHSFNPSSSISIPGLGNHIFPVTVLEGSWIEVEPGSNATVDWAIWSFERTREQGVARAVNEILNAQEEGAEAVQEALRRAQEIERGIINPDDFVGATFRARINEQGQLEPVPTRRQRPVVPDLPVSHVQRPQPAAVKPRCHVCGEYGELDSEGFFRCPECRKRREDARGDELLQDRKLELGKDEENQDDESI